MEPRPNRLNARLRVRDRIRQGISLRRPLPSDVAIDEANLAANLRVTRDDKELEIEEHEQAELREAVPVLHQRWNLVDSGGPRPARFGRRALAKGRRAGRRLLLPFLSQQTEYNGANARAISVLMNRSLRQEEILKTLSGQAFDAIGVSLRGHTEALLEIDRTLSKIEQDLARVVPLDDDIDHLAFAERFRGNEAEVKERLRPHVAHLSSGEGEVIDLAAGRGELLELLAEAGLEARGFETAVALVDHGRAKGLPVERRPALSVLAETQPNSLAGVAAIGLVDALEPGTLVRLVRLAVKALHQGGGIVLDLAEATGFAPSRSYRPELIAWLLEEEGFRDVEAAAGAVSGRKT